MNKLEKLISEIKSEFDLQAELAGVNLKNKKIQAFGMNMFAAGINFAMKYKNWRLKNEI